MDSILTNGDCLPCSFDQANYKLINGKCCKKDCQNCTQKTRFELVNYCSDCTNGKLWNDDSNQCESPLNCLKDYWIDGLDIGLGICYKCSQQCLRQAFNIKEGKLVNTDCDNQMYSVVNQNQTIDCLPCNLACLACRGPNSTDCTLCFSDCKYDGQCIQKDQCAGNLFVDGNNICQLCDNSCTTCDGTASYCTSCSGNLYLYEDLNQCLSCDISNNKFKTDDQRCLSCHSDCQICTNETMNGCQQCNQNLALFIENGQKVCKPCGEGYFIQDGWCLQCNSKCKECTSQTICTSCVDSFILQSYGLCDTCDTSNSYVIINNICYKCSDNCQTCSNSTKTGCINCKSGFYKMPDNSCVSSCPKTGYYANASNECKKCDTKCKVCIDNTTNCTTCADGYYKKQNDPSCNSCDTTNGYFISSQLCTQCYTDCQTCFGTGEYNCFSCINNKKLVQGKNNCVDSCPNKYYLSFSTCKKCIPYCNQCIGSDTCQECETSKYYLSSAKACVTCTDVGYYNDGKECFKCDSSCSTCNGINNTNCLTCTNGNFISEETSLCVNCGDGWFVDGNFCRKCDSSCSTCSGSKINCTSCPIGKYRMITDNSCVDSCPIENFYVNDKICSQCHNDCKICKGSEYLDCVKCSQDGYFIYEDKQCYQGCDENSGYVRVDENNCQKCGEFCQTCYVTQLDGDKDINCKKCKNGHYFYPDKTCKQCYEFDQQYIYDVDKCGQCYSNCQTCSDDKQTSCLSCIPDLRMLDNNSCQKCEDLDGYYIDGIKCSKCQENCKKCTKDSCTLCFDDKKVMPNGQCQLCPQEGYFSDNLNCYQCDVSCKTCTDTGNNNCKMCDNNLNYFLLGGLCVQCPSNYFVKDGHCVQCHSSCDNCYGDQETNCISCALNLFKYENGSCDLCNGSGFYKDGNNCTSCAENCKQCTSKQQSDCQTCNDGYFKMPDKSCNICPQQGYYQQGDLCLQCDASCLECNGQAINNCLSCALTYYKYADKNNIDQFTCIKCEGSNQYKDGNECKDCSNNCKQCQTSNNCEICEAGFKFLVDENNGAVTCVDCNVYPNLFIDGDYCKKCDQDGYYTKDKLCNKCNSSCKQCDGPDSNNCLECYQDNFIIKDTKTCGECNTNLRMQLDENKICQDCHSSCQTCSIPNDQSKCLTCIDTKYILDNLCQDCDEQQNYFKDGLYCRKCSTTCSKCSSQTIEDAKNGKCDICADNYKFDEQSSICIKCDETQGRLINGSKCLTCFNTCMTCSDINHNNCLSCKQNLFKTIDNQCLDCNQEGFYISNKSCLNCDTSKCKSCQNQQDQCLQCADNLHFIEDSQNCDTCLIEQGWYLDNNKCRRCFSNCDKCSDSTETTCSKCSSDYYFIEGKCSKCENDRGYYISGDQCLVCQSCKTCDTNGFCTSCPDGFSFEGDNQNCITCGINSGQFLDINNNRCYNCDRSCKTCNGNQPNNCQQCIKGKYFSENTCTECKVGNSQFIDDNDQECKDCIKDCKECQNSTTCKKCVDNKYILEGTCQLCDISLNFYIDKDSLNCGKCDNSCKQCNGPTGDECTSCDLDKYILYNTGKCISCLKQDGYYLKDNICYQCHATCKTCQGKEDTDCELCANDLSKLNGKCQKCDIDTLPQYIDNTTNECKQCDSSCHRCEGPSATECIDCPDNTYLQGDTKICGPCDIKNKKYIDNGHCRDCHTSCLECNKSSLATACFKCSVGLYFYQGLCQSCQIGQFNDGINCLQCDNTQCQECVDSPTKCTSCNSQQFLQEDTNTCGECDLDNQKYLDDKQICRQCHLSCKKCNQSSANDCTECNQKDGYYLKEGSSNICEICQTNNKFFIEGNVCKLCDSSCLTCSANSVNKCTSCENGLYLQGGEEASCQICEINQGKFLDQNSICQSCDSTCKTCSDGRKESCQLCADGLHKLNGLCQFCNTQNGFYIQDNDCLPCQQNCQECQNNVCSKCVNGTSFRDDTLICESCLTANQRYIDLLTNKCKDCSPNCQTCTGPNENQCQDCISGKSFISLNTCSDCDLLNQKYVNVDTNTCENCNSTCQQCDGPADTQCSKCKNNLFKRLDKGGVCEECKSVDGLFILNDECRVCDSSCQECSGDKNNCTKCSGTQKLYEDNTCNECNTTQDYFVDPVTDKCIKCHSDCKTCNGKSNSNCITCNLLHYFFNESNVCTPCHSDCESCNGPQQNQCTKCLNGKFITTNNNICGDCLESQYVEELGKKCVDCPQYCQQCLNSSTCFTCIGGYSILQNGLCGKCSSDEYVDSNNKCQKCDASCQTCKGKLDTQCITCRNSIYNIRLDTQKCGVCDSNQYVEDNQCKQCLDSCKSCSNISECDECAINLYFQENTKVCSGCDTSQQKYLDDTKKICYSCFTSCQTCKGGTSSDCLTCGPGSSFIGPGQCSICDTKNGKYVNNQNECLDCDNSCLTCDGKQNTDCKQCKNGLYRRNDLQNLCQICNTTDGFYIDNYDCKQCHSDCKECTGGQLQTQCKICRDNKLINQTTNICEKCDITKNYYEEGQYCKQCHSDCKTCKGGQQTDCIECAASNYYLDNNLCKECHNDCLTCKGSSNTQCIKCAKLGYYITKQNNQCGFCQPNEFNDGQKCISCSDKCIQCTSESNCLRCDKSAAPLRKDGTCNICDKGQFIDSDNKCQDCHADCDYCIGPDQNQCTKCKDSSKFIRTDTNLCGSCDQNQYSEGSNCKNCHTDCSQCTGPLNTQCKLCSNNNQFYCSREIIQQFTQNPPFPLGDRQIECSTSCLSCHKNCQTCFGQNQDQCMKCTIGTLQTDLSCQKICQNGQFYDEAQNKCISCESNCLSCSSLNQCKQCKPDFILYEGSCYKCQDGQYFEKSLKQCIPCHSKCLTCTGSSESQCIKCKDPNQFFDQNNNCVSSCEEGYIKNDTTNICQLCVYKVENNIKRCQVQCGNKEYVEENTRICKNCIKNCSKCSMQSTCDVCETGYSFLSSNKDSCDRCPKFQSPNPENLCVACPFENCDVCIQTQCLKCAQQYLQANNGCVKDKRYDVYSCSFEKQEDCEKEIEVINQTDMSLRSVQITQTVVQTGISSLTASATSFTYSIQLQQIIGNLIFVDQLKTLSVGPIFIGQSFSMNILSIIPSPFTSSDSSDEDSQNNQESNRVSQRILNSASKSVATNSLSTLHSQDLSNQFIVNTINFFILIFLLLIIFKISSYLRHKHSQIQRLYDNKYYILIWVNSIFSNFMFVSVFKSFLNLNLSTGLSIVSFILQCIYIVLYFYFITLLFRLVNSYVPEEKSQTCLVKFNYLIQNLDVNNKKNRFFWFIFEARKIISLGFVILIGNKIVAASLILGINICFFCYLYFSNPFVIRHQQRYYQIIEIAQIVINFSILGILVFGVKQLSWLTIIELWILNILILLYALFLIILYFKRKLFTKKVLFNRETIYGDTNRTFYQNQYYSQNNMPIQNLTQISQHSNFHTKGEMELSSDCVNQSKTLNRPLSRQYTHQNTINQYSIRTSANPIFIRKVDLSNISNL